MCDVFVLVLAFFCQYIKISLETRVEEEHVDEDGCMFCRGKMYRLQYKLDQTLDL